GICVSTYRRRDYTPVPEFTNTVGEFKVLCGAGIAPWTVTVISASNLPECRVSNAASSASQNCSFSSIQSSLGPGGKFRLLNSRQNIWCQHSELGRRPSNSLVCVHLALPITKRIGR